MSTSVAGSLIKMRKEAGGLQPFVPGMSDMTPEQIRALTGLEKIVTGVMQLVEINRK